jgi:hypothetical protein
VIYELHNKPKDIEIALLDRAISFACDYLDLDINFVLEFKKLKEQQFGFCDYDDDETIITISASVNKNDIVRTLFHEMVHMKQHSDGRLSSGSPQIWMGKVYNETYENLPWELEAFELEQQMMSAFEL